MIKGIHMKKTNKSAITNVFSYDIDIGINCYNLSY